MIAEKYGKNYKQSEFGFFHEKLRGNGGQGDTVRTASTPSERETIPTI